MMSEFEFFHGSVFAGLIRNSKDGINIKPFPSQSNASYVLNGDIGIFIKHSAKRMSPWRFSFIKEHQDEILEMKNKLNEVFIILVCGKDGIVTLDFQELKQILNEIHTSIEWVSVSRSKNTEYTVNGSDGTLRHKVGRADFPRKIFKKHDKIKKNTVFSWFK